MEAQRRGLWNATGQPTRWTISHHSSNEGRQGGSGPRMERAESFAPCFGTNSRFRTTMKPCSCGGTNENCRWCSGSGQVPDQQPIPPQRPSGSDYLVGPYVSENRVVINYDDHGNRIEPSYEVKASAPPLTWDEQLTRIFVVVRKILFWIAVYTAPILIAMLIRSLFYR